LRARLLLRSDRLRGRPRDACCFIDRIAVQRMGELTVQVELLA
jgi:hypothetical protein